MKRPNAECIVGLSRMLFPAVGLDEAGLGDRAIKSHLRESCQDCEGQTFQLVFRQWEQIPDVWIPQDAGTVRLIAGEYRGNVGPAKTCTPLNLRNVNLKAGMSAELSLPNGHTTMFFALSGDVVVNDERDTGEGDLAIFARTGIGIKVKAKTDALLLLMDGEPISDPVVGHGPFVMNSRAEIQQAIEQYQLGKMGEIR